ncbi:DUF3349 domain-containing protein [Corynebacterium callunae]|uniref:DUF3349 domain-containing protein n=1 Tax=Corynebacterium callunae TaxID=1721 RepID=UPI00398206A2
MSNHEHPSLAHKVLHWLRQGYPAGVPRNDTFALFYVLERELNEADLDELAQLLIEQGSENGLHPKPVTREKIAKLISHVHNQPPEAADIERIQQKLKGEGFPTQD